VKPAVLALIVCLASAVGAQEPPAPLRVVVRSEGAPVAAASGEAAGQAAETDASGVAELLVPAGTVRVSVSRTGLFEATAQVQVAAGRVTTVEVDLVPQPDLDEEVVVVASTRTGRRLEDQPTRVEVLGREEIEEKLLMTPGDIVMMLNEMGGLRVQATSPSIGAASVRVQGMPGRYTRVLSDGLPLFGQQVGGLGLLQIPPMDLGQVEVIKGVASAFYGTTATMTAGPTCRGTGGRC
jgi:iron complex outermembrane receptor protein